MIKSSYTVLNTVTGPKDYISYLQPSEEASAWYDTNTYYSRLTVTRTLHDQFVSKRVVSDEKILTQVVITESLPGRGTPQVSMNIEDEYMYIYATKSSLTTVTYLAKPLVDTLTLKEANMDLQTQVVKKVITDIVPSSLLQADLLSTFRTQLMLENDSYNCKVITLATLLNGQTLQITALRYSTNSTNSFGAKTEMPKITSSFVDKESSIKTTRNQNGLGSSSERVYESKTNGLNMSESQHSYEYREPPAFNTTPKTPTPPTVEHIIGTFNLERFRPVFNVMADLLQKNKEVSQRKQQKLKETGQANQTVDERPVYIPIKLTGNTKKKNSLISGDMTIDPKLNRITAQSLHINPPQMHNLEENSTLFPIQKHHALISHGIPIRPGEIINANADVIIGRPNGIIQQLVQPLKKKSRLPPPPPTLHPHNPSHSLMPPFPFAVENFHRLHPEQYATINMLRPPAPSYFRPSASPLTFNKPRQQITNLNAELNDNEIIEILPIPQIFSTKLPAVTHITYAKVDSTTFPNLLPSAHHRVNFKTDVLIHDVAINVPPLTFKQESDNFPATTAIRGHILLPTMPLVKIPTNKAHIDVRLTPQGNRLDVSSITIENEPKSESKLTSTSKQRYQNPLKQERLNIPVSNKIAFFSSNNWKSLKPKTQSSDWNDSVQMPSLKNYDLTYLKPTYKLQQNKSFEFKISRANQSFPYHNLNYSSARNNFELEMFSVSSIRPGNKAISLGQPFMTQNQSFALGEGATSVQSDFHKKLYLATGEPFTSKPAGYEDESYKLLKSTGQHNTIKYETEVMSIQPQLTLQFKAQPPRSSTSIKATNFSVLDSFSFNNKQLFLPISSTTIILVQSSPSFTFMSSFDTRKFPIVPAPSLTHEASRSVLPSQKLHVVPSYSSKSTLPLDIKQSAYSALKSSIINTKPISQNETNLKLTIREQLMINNKPIKTSKSVNLLKTTESWKNDINTHTIRSMHSNQSFLISLEPSEALNKNNDLSKSDIFGISKFRLFSSEPARSKSKIKETVEYLTNSSSMKQNVIAVYRSRDATNTEITNINTKSVDNIDKFRQNASKISVVMTKATGNYSNNNNRNFDYDANASFELPSRDEDFVPPLNSNNVFLGGVITAKSSKNQYLRPVSEDFECNPSCKSAKNEICLHFADHSTSCECRLGFARMFADRPCKRKYLYNF